jgi:predicted dehydrogenase
VKNLKAGIIGCGQMAHNHASAYQEIPGVELVAAHDRDARRAERMCATFGIRQLGLRELLEAVDVVSICTWPASHCALTLAALQAGKHVMCEKPPAANVEEAARMAEAADERQLVLTYGLLYRHVFRDSAELVRAAGRPLTITGRWLRRRGFPQWSPAGFRESTGGALTDLGVHVLDLSWYLMGCPDPVAVEATTWNHEPPEPDRDVTDSASLTVRMSNGSTATVAVAYASHTLAGEETHVEVEGPLGRLRLPMPTHQTVMAPDLLPRFHGNGSTAALAHARPKLVHEAIRDQLGNFRDSVLGLSTPLVTADEAVTLQRMLDLALVSARSGESIAIDGPVEERLPIAGL